MIDIYDICSTNSAAKRGGLNCIWCFLSSSEKVLSSSTNDPCYNDVYVCIPRISVQLALR